MRFGVALKEQCPLCGQDVPDPDRVLTIGTLEVRPVDGTVTLDGVPLRLTPTERRMLVLVVMHRGELVTWADLLEQTGSIPSRRDGERKAKHNLRVHLARLKAKLGPEIARRLEHIRGPLSEGGLRLTGQGPSPAPPGSP